MRNVQRESWCHGRSLIPHNRYLKSDKCSNRRSSFSLSCRMCYYGHLSHNGARFASLAVSSYARLISVGCR